MHTTNQIASLAQRQHRRGMEITSFMRAGTYLLTGGEIALALLSFCDAVDYGACASMLVAAVWQDFLLAR